MRSRPAACLLALACAGCTVGPDYVRPAAIVPTQYKEEQGWKPAQPRDDVDRGAWWSVYHDPALDALERQVDVSNQTLKVSEAAYRQASALVRGARSSLFPSLTLSPTVDRSYSGPGIGGGSSTRIRSAGGSTNTSSSAEGSAAWELDVWGRIRRTIESDAAGAQASAADLANARLSLQGQVAVDYFDLRAADALTQLLTDTVAEYQRALQITQNQYGAGTAARSDVITAQTQLLAAQAQLVNAGVQRATLEHALAVLTGRPPAEFTLGPDRLAVAVPVAPTLLPAVLLERRPDIAAAERVMQQQNALIGAAVAAYYPTINLSALGGWSGGSVGSLLSAANTLWSLGAAASQTLFSGGLRPAQVDAARAVYDQAVATYRQTVLTAFQGVEDELSTLRILEQEAAVEAQTVSSARQALQITLNEYRAGLVAYTTVITAQTTLLSAQEAALTIQQNRLVASATLIQDLGGGWDATALPDSHTLTHQGPIFP